VQELQRELLQQAWVQVRERVLQPSEPEPQLQRERRILRQE
jgi:hypothetical protein